MERSKILGKFNSVLHLTYLTLYRYLTSERKKLKPVQTHLNELSTLTLANKMLNEVIDLIRQHKWNELNDYLNRIGVDSWLKYTDHGGRTLLHFVVHGSNPPREIIENILSKCPKAALVKDNFRHTPLHLSVLNGNENATFLISKLAPESILSFDSAGKIPMYYCIQQGFVKDVEMMLELHPSALMKINLKGDTALDFFFKRQFRFIHKMVNDSSPSIDQVPLISMNNKNCKEIYDMSHVLLFYHHRIKSPNTSDCFTVLEDALISPSVPWVLCEFLVRMAPDQLVSIENDFFDLLNKSSKKHIYEKIFTCTVCSVSRTRCNLIGTGDFVVCDKCGKDGHQNFTSTRDEGLEKCQLIFSCLLMHPTLCAV